MKNKDPLIDIDSFGQNIYKNLKKHRSQSLLDLYCLCSHYCIECYSKWTHRTIPNNTCSLYWLYCNCEGCLTWNFDASKKQKLDSFTSRQREAVIKWAKKHGVKIT